MFPIGLNYVTINKDNVLLGMGRLTR